MKLAAKHPSVGMMVTLDNVPKDVEIEPQDMYSHGSAVLIDCSAFAPGLKGRVALTAAHVVFNEATNHPYETLFFGKDAQERISASSVFMHDDYDHEKTLNDIAVLILSTPSSGVPCLVNWDSPKEDIQNQDVAHCGFGVVQALNNMASIIHTLPHASYSQVFCPYSDGLHGVDVTSLWQTTKDADGKPISEKEIKISTDKGSVFHTSPFVSGEVGGIAVEHRALAGTVSGGDSGGGCFLNDGMLVGVHSETFQNSSLATPDQLFRDPSFLKAYPGLMKKASGKKLEFVDVDDAFSRAGYSSNLRKTGSIVNARCVFLPFYKDWIFKTVQGVEDKASV